MKRIFSIILAFLLALSLSPVANAQLFTVGAGYNGIFERLRSADGPSMSYTNGITAGFDWHYGFHRHIGYDVGLTYMLAFSRGENRENPGMKEHYRQHAILVPLAINYSFMRIRYDYQLFIYGGPTVELGISSRLYPEGRESINLYSPDTGGQRRFNVWAGGGIGVDIFRSTIIKVGFQHSFLNDANHISRNMFTVGVEFTLFSKGAWQEVY